MSNASLAHNTDPEGTEAVASRSEAMDRGGLESVRRVGESTEGLRTSDKRKERAETDYVYDTGVIVLKVLGALQGRTCEPVNIARVAQRTGLDRDKCRRGLLTLKHAGWAKQVLDGRRALWVLGPRAYALAGQVGNQNFANLQSQSQIS
jgi:hypothetical protein